jgi:hypothetical protein
LRRHETSRSICADRTASWRYTKEAWAGTRLVGAVFDKGAQTTRIADGIEGNQPVMYRFKPKKGQLVAVELRPRNQDTEFVLFAAGKWPGTELHGSAAKGSRQYSGQVDGDGMHAILVSQSAGDVMRAVLPSTIS